jgi:hypothetical protein
MTTPVLGGCIMAEPPDTDRLFSAAAVPALTGEFAGKVASMNWLPYVLPSDNQRTDTTCVLRSIAGNAEAVARRAGHTIPRGRQINVAPSYALAVRKRYDGRDQGGLTPGDGIWAATRTAILPPGTRAEASKSMGGCMALLNDGPVLLCLWVTPGWWTIQRNGYMDPLKGTREHLSGHCVLGLGLLQDGDEVYWLIQDWQGAHHGWNGCAIIHWRAWQATMHSQGALGIVRPAGGERWDGWRANLVVREEG